MILSNSLFRRYTPPTCTLEITAQASPLFRWARQSRFKQLRFRLRFEDPRQLQEQAVEISGDRAQLEALEAAIESYIQQLLSQTPHSQNGDLGASTLEHQENHQQSVLTRPESELRPIHLRPKGVLSHELFFGSLATDLSGLVINLTASSLFDLATALEEATAEATEVTPSFWLGLLHSSPLWTRVAAGAVVFVGITLAAVQLSNKSGSNPNGAVPLISQRTQPAPVSPLPLPGISTLPPFESLPSVPLPSSLPQVGSTTPPGSVAPSLPKPVLQTQRPGATPKSPQQPKQIIAVQPKAGGSPLSLPEVPDLETSPAAPPNPTASQDHSISTTPAQPANETAFDTVPQIAEARSFFQQRWQAPPALKQTLEYTLTLNSNGSVQQITPLNQAARTYLDRTPIPLRGEHLVSPIQGASLKIRLVLGPDGSVKTFPQ